LDNRFFEAPILNSPFKYASHRELDEMGQPNPQVINCRRRAAKLKQAEVRSMLCRVRADGCGDRRRKRTHPSRLPR